VLIDLAIVGAGSMGANHARVGLGLRDARISAIVDPDPERGGKLATTVGAAYYPDVTGLPATVDAAVVAVPTDLHVPVSTELLAMGKHVLVEKPIARTVADARFLVGAARDAGKILMVGHVERFNPAVVELAAIVAEPIHIDAQRVSAFVGRIREGVVLDLMTHDLDIVTALVNRPVVEVQASVSTLRSGMEDLGVALLRFEGGTSATITASRIGQDKIRRISVTESEAYYVADLLRQDLTIHRQTHPDYTAETRGYRQQSLIEIPYITTRGEPLHNELEHFVRCVIDGSEPLVSGESATATIELVQRVLTAAGTDAIAS
jgi:predicted dehydrogenase